MKLAEIYFREENNLPVAEDYTKRVLIQKSRLSEAHIMMGKIEEK